MSRDTGQRLARKLPSLKTSDRGRWQSGRYGYLVNNLIAIVPT
jgi:hypothetical protein